MMGTAYTVLVYLSLSKFQAERTGFAQFRSMIDQIPYFREKFPRGSQSSRLHFPQNVLFIHGTSETDVIGMNLIASILDEANFFQQSTKVDEDAYQRVIDLHSSLLNRQKSRFMSGGGDISLSVLISSSTYKSSYTQRRIEAAQSSLTTKVVLARLWDVKPSGTYSDKTFPVFLGNEKLDPFVIDSPADLSSRLGVRFQTSLSEISLDDAIGSLPSDYQILIDYVPIDFYDTYTKGSTIAAVQEFSGHSVSAQGKLFTSREIFARAVTSDLPDLFTKYEFPIATMDDSPSNRVEFYLRDISFVNPECPRYIHIDQSLRHDATGFACCHKKGYTEIDGESLPIFHLDFALRIVPPPDPQRISIGRIREFIYYMRDSLRLSIGKVTYDQYACLGPGTPVLTPHGCRAVEDIAVGDIVTTECGYCPVSACFSYSDAPVYTLSTLDGHSLVCTGNHRFMRICGGVSSWCRVSDLSCGDLLKLYCPSGGDEFFTEVSSVVFSGYSDVYDIEVGSVHSYVADGLLSHNSAESLQVLNEERFDAGVLSVDRNDSQYLYFVSLLYQNRIFIPQFCSEGIARELFDLNHFRERQKVDHPETNSKDLMDAVVGAVWNCFESNDMSSHTTVDLLNFTGYNRGGTASIIRNTFNGKTVDLDKYKEVKDYEIAPFSSRLRFRK